MNTNNISTKKKLAISINILLIFIYELYRMDVTALPTWQDCHELWSKKRKRDLRVRENQPKTNESGEPIPAGGLVSYIFLYIHVIVKYLFQLIIYYFSDLEFLLMYKIMKII